MEVVVVIVWIMRWRMWYGGGGGGGGGCNSEMVEVVITMVARVMAVDNMVVVVAVGVQVVAVMVRPWRLCWLW